MKKIITGMVYNLFRSFEIWALLILVVLTSALYDFSNLRNLDCINACVFGETIMYNEDDPEFATVIINPENVSQYTFKDSGISAFDLYRMTVEPVSKDVYKKVSEDMYNEPREEMWTVFKSMLSLDILPAVLMAIFIPVFFGRLFSDGTIKNYLSCGFSKAKIYLSALVLTFVIDIAVFIIRFLMFLLMCCILRWQPPVYLPVLIPAAILSLLVLFTVTSVCLASLFVSTKKTIAFIVGFLMAFSFYISVSKVAMALFWNYQYLATNSVQDDEYKDVLKEHGRSLMTEKFNYGTFSSDFYYNGEVVLSFGLAEDVPEAFRYAMLAAIYADPVMVQGTEFSFEPYLLARDGVIYLSMGVNVFWMILVTGIGVTVFRKREINC